MKKIICTFFLLLVSCEQPDITTYHRTSMIKVIVNPDDFYGERLELRGYLKADTNLRLYVDKERAKSGDMMSAVLIEDKSKKGKLLEKCGEKSVAVSGVLVNKQGRIQLQDIEKIIITEDNTTCWLKGGD